MAAERSTEENIVKIQQALSDYEQKVTKGLPAEKKISNYIYKSQK